VPISLVNLLDSEILLWEHTGRHHCRQGHTCPVPTHFCHLQFWTQWTYGDHSMPVAVTFWVWANFRLPNVPRLPATRPHAVMERRQAWMPWFVCWTRRLLAGTRHHCRSHGGFVASTHPPPPHPLPPQVNLRDGACGRFPLPPLILYGSSTLAPLLPCVSLWTGRLHAHFRNQPHLL